MLKVINQPGCVVILWKVTRYNTSSLHFNHPESTFYLSLHHILSLVRRLNMQALIHIFGPSPSTFQEVNYAGSITAQKLWHISSLPATFCLRTEKGDRQAYYCRLDNHCCSLMNNLGVRVSEVNSHLYHLPPLHEEKKLLARLNIFRYNFAPVGKKYTYMIL